MCNTDINRLADRLREIERTHARLFASMIEFHIQLSILKDNHEELHRKNQQLRAIGAFFPVSKKEHNSLYRNSNPG